MTIIEDWIKTEQSKHRLCICGCGQEIIIKSHHYKIGVPQYFPGHYSKLVANTQYYIDKRIKNESFINGNQGKHVCQCGCGNDIKIQANHITDGIPKYIKGHYIGKVENLIKMEKWIKNEQSKHRLCACGCNEEIIIKKIHYDDGYIPKYIVGHSNKNRIISNETRIKMSISKKNMSEETKKKMSDAKKGVKRTDRPGLPMSKARRFKISGKNHYNWKGGISFGPYCHKFNNRLKERIRERDNRTCQGCGVKENGSKLSIHHIHYDKENCYPDLVAVCRSCNTKANHNRDYWEQYYMNILETRGLLNWS